MDLSGVPDLEYLSSPTLVRIHPALYVNPRLLAAAYTDEHGVAVLLLASGREIPQPGVNLADLVAPFITE